MIFLPLLAALDTSLPAGAASWVRTFLLCWQSLRRPSTQRLMRFFQRLQQEVWTELSSQPLSYLHIPKRMLWRKKLLPTIALSFSLLLTWKC
jgi:hypothetical protein